MVGPDNDLPLPKRLFELAAIVPPPSPIQFLRHHLENDNLVFLDFPVSTRGSLGGSAGKGCRSAKSFGQVLLNGTEEAARKRRPVIVLKRQKQFDKVHARRIKRVRACAVPVLEAAIRGCERGMELATVAELLSDCG